MHAVIPAPFRERYSSLTDDPDAFLSALQQRPSVSFRVNTLKASSANIRSRFREYDILSTPVRWSTDAFISTPAALQTIEHALGQIYFQSLSSMLPPLLLELGAAVSSGQPVLDACAAPGSKTTQLAALLQNRGLIIANDSDYNRLRALKFNCEKAGALNVAILNSDLRRLPLPPGSVPLILLDAPCSGEGTAGSDPLFFRYWSLQRIASFSRLQQQLLTTAFSLLAPGGTLLYSTCTFAPEENEGAVHNVLQSEPEASLEKIALENFPFSPAVTEWNKTIFSPELKNTARVWPHLHNTEGFFLAKIRKI